MLIRKALGTSSSPAPPLATYSGENTTILLHGNGVNATANQSFIDSSANGATLTATSNLMQGSFGPFGNNWSMYFNGAYLFSTATTTAFGTNNFTIEMWIRSDKTVSGYISDTTACFLQNSTTTSGIYGYGIFVNSTGNLVFNSYNGSSATAITTIKATTPLLCDTWYHIAFVRRSNILYCYVNGVLNMAGAGTISTNFTYGYLPTVGANSSGLQPFKGFISNLRIIRGSAIYTSDFLPSKIPLTAITGTVVLLCASNRIKDKSVNNYTYAYNIVLPLISKRSPFTDLPYDVATDSSSIYFSTSQRLSCTPSSNFSFGTGDFTVETYVYRSYTTSSYGVILDTSSTSSTGTGIAIRIHSAGSITITSGAQSILSTAGNVIIVPFNCWTHIAVCSIGRVITAYINGISIGSATSIYTFSETSCFVGNNSTLRTDAFWGYMSNYRIIKGTALYSSNFTPPTAPLTAISGTQLLLLGANAAMIDNTKYQNWLSSGAAQITTSSSKYGSGSIKLNSGGYFQTPITTSPPIFMNPTLQTWTMEMWLNKTSSVASVIPIFGDFSTTAATSYWSIGQTSAGAISFTWNALNISSSSIPSVGTWVHIAVVCNAGSIKIYFNGVNEGSTGTLTAVTSTFNLLTLGGYNNGSCPYLVSDLRVTNGKALYLANFTPPTEQLPG